MDNDRNNVPDRIIGAGPKPDRELMDQAVAIAAGVSVSDSSTPAGEISEVDKRWAEAINDMAERHLEEKSALRSERNKLRADVAALRAEIDTHLGFIEEMTKANDALRAERDGALGFLATIGQADAGGMRAAWERVQEAEAERDALRDEVGRLHKAREHHLAERDALRAERDRLLDWCDAVAKSEPDWQAEVERMRPVVEAVRRQIEDEGWECSGCGDCPVCAYHALAVEHG